MDFTEMKTGLLVWIDQNSIQLIVTAVGIFLYILLDRIGAPRVKKGADRREFESGAASRILRVVRTVFALFGALFLLVVWGVDPSAVLIVATTTITLLGVALFASWSLLSNVTAYFVLLWHPTFTRGTFIRVIDGDNYVQGYISDLSLFSVELITEDKEVIIYPNNLLLGRVALINPEVRSGAAGKLSIPVNDTNPVTSTKPE